MADKEDLDTTPEKNDRPRNNPGVLKVLQSIAAGAFGVQSAKRHQEDFNSHSPWPYVIAGILFTAGFIAVLVFIVSWVLAGR